MSFVVAASFRRAFRCGSGLADRVKLWIGGCGHQPSNHGENLVRRKATGRNEAAPYHWPLLLALGGKWDQSKNLPAVYGVTLAHFGRALMLCAGTQTETGIGSSLRTLVRFGTATEAAPGWFPRPGSCGQRDEGVRCQRSCAERVR